MPLLQFNNVSSISWVWFSLNSPTSCASISSLLLQLVKVGSDYSTVASVLFIKKIRVWVVRIHNAVFSFSIAFYVPSISFEMSNLLVTAQFGNKISGYVRHQILMYPYAFMFLKPMEQHSYPYTSGGC